MQELPGYESDELVAGCDEAGRGCLAGPVVAAAVILPPGYRNHRINDSKKVAERLRVELAAEIRHDAVAWGTGMVDAAGIDAMNILQASILAMHKALDAMPVRPGFIIVDGNRFIPYQGIPYATFIQGDGRYLEIAAASILAKTLRDDYMKAIHREFPGYGWDRNKGYPSQGHIRQILEQGRTPYHRKSFHIRTQLSMKFG